MIHARPDDREPGHRTSGSYLPRDRAAGPVASTTSFDAITSPPRRAPADGPRPSEPDRDVRDRVGDADDEPRRPHGRGRPGRDGRRRARRESRLSRTTPTRSSISRPRFARRPEDRVSLIETMYGLAADGKTNRWGIPNPLRMARHRRSALRHRPPLLPPGSSCSARPSRSAPRSAASSATALSTRPSTATSLAARERRVGRGISA